MNYHKISIGSVNIDGQDRMPDYKQIFPTPPVGKKVLDIGCFIGFFTFQAMHEGAQRCVGVELNKDTFNKGCKIRDQLGFEKVQLINGNAENEVIEEMFDTVLCLNLLHHLQTIDRVKKLLTRIDGWSTERMVFIVTTPTDPTTVSEEVINKNGRQKTRLSGEFFADFWPNYRIEFAPSISWPKRLLVDVRKS